MTVSAAPPPAVDAAPYRPSLLLLAAAGGAFCGIVYELLLASLASYLLGGAVLVFSLTVGGFLASMGLGAYLSRGVRDRLLQAFLGAEIAIGVVGGMLPLGLLAVYTASGDSAKPYVAAHAVGTVLIGALVGLELPLLTRMLERGDGLRVAIARALALDYVGALVGSVAFPLLLLPALGILGTAAAVGTVGAGLAVTVAWSHRRLLPSGRLLAVVSLAATVALAASIVPARWAGDRLEDRLYGKPIVTRAQSRYQRIVVTEAPTPAGQDVRLYLDGDLQLSTLDEHHYHEGLVHPALSAHPHPRRVLLLGAGDGLALREVLAYATVREVVLIELDEAVVDLARAQPALRRAGRGSFGDPRVQVVIDDAFVALRRGQPPLDRAFDVILADFPDPDNEALGRLYTTTFFRWVSARLAPGGFFATQATSPHHAPRSYACIKRTLETAGFGVRPYVVDVPTFGAWGFHLAAVGSAPDVESIRLRVPTRFLTQAMLKGLFALGTQLSGRQDVVANRLLDPVLLGYHYRARWGQR